MQTDPLIGRQLANYRVERLLGRGGMARVYFGWDVVLDRPVALKVIDVLYRDDPAYVARFLREGRVMAAWRHPNIVHVYYAGEEEGVAFLALEHVPGTDLKALMSEYAAAGRPMPDQEVLRIGRRVADALDFAHARGVIHRDVKPANVLVADDGRVLLTDFGLVLQTTEGSSGEAFGSPHYIAPEQARSSMGVVPQSDLYSLGVILYEMLTGYVPFDDPSPASLAVQHLTQSPPPPRDVNPALNEATEQVLLRALAKKPEQRFQSGRDLLDALGAALNRNAVPGERELPVTTPPVRPVRERIAEHVARRPHAEPVALPVDQAHQASARSRPRWLWLGVAGAVLVLLLCFVGGFFAVLALQDNDDGGVEAPPLPQAEATQQAGGSAPGTTSAENEPAPTLTVPSGEGNATLTLLYNRDSFYVLNTSNREIPASRLSFVALADGAPTRFAFDGSIWAAFYPSIQRRGCNTVEVLGGVHLNPGSCQRYNAIVTPEDTDPQIFWIARDGIGRFQVLWNGAEVGRCLAAPDETAQECVVQVPAP